jgi:hypothetical protein
MRRRGESFDSKLTAGVMAETNRREGRGRRFGMNADVQQTRATLGTRAGIWARAGIGTRACIGTRAIRTTCAASIDCSRTRHFSKLPTITTTMVRLGTNYATARERALISLVCPNEIAFAQINPAQGVGRLLLKGFKRCRDPGADLFRLSRAESARSVQRSSADEDSTPYCAANSGFDWQADAMIRSIAREAKPCDEATRVERDAAGCESLPQPSTSATPAILPGNATSEAVADPAAANATGRCSSTAVSSAASRTCAGKNEMASCSNEHAGSVVAEAGQGSRVRDSITKRANRAFTSACIHSSMIWRSSLRRFAA